MASEIDIKVAMALLEEVDKKVQQELGGQIARPMSFDNDPTEVVDRAFFCGELVKQCEMAERKAPGDNDVLLRSLILKAQLYGNWQKTGSVRGTQKSMYQCYEQALQMVKDPALEAAIRYRFALASRVAVAGVGGGNVVENFQKVIELAGADSALGIECAKELEKDKTKKGGCFIATACYGSYDAPAVITLRQFRDEVLLVHPAGKLFVRFYYSVSPPVADFIASRENLKNLVRTLLVGPVVSISKRFMAR